MKVCQNAPNVFVSANHSSTSKNLDPMYNSITAWVEVRNLVCLCNILFTEFQFTELCICANFLTLGMRCPLGFRLNTVNLSITNI